MLKYSQFLEKVIFDLVNESRVYFSPELKKYLELINNDISKDLINMEGEDIKPDMTFVNLDKEGYFSFITMKNASKLIQNKYPNMTNFGDEKSMASASILSDPSYDPGLYTNSRNPIKIGRFINSVFPGKYTSKQVEEFVNQFKASIEDAKEKILVVEGDQIDYWYNAENYLKDSGTLGGSCMRYIRGVFDIYNKNPDVCKLVILVQGGKLKGRALLWKIGHISGSDEKFEYFMDRQYTIADSDVIKFRNYATEQGWAYKTNNNHSSLKGVTYKEKDLNVEMMVYVDDTDYDRYPFMDTFRVYDPNSGILYNISESDNYTGEYNGFYLLDSTSGSYTELEPESTDVWSEYYSEDIPEDDAVWSEPLDDHIWRDRSVRITRGSRGNRGYWPSDSDDIVYSDYDDEYYHMDDSTYSDHHQSWIYSEDAVDVVSRILNDGDCNTDSYYLSGDDTTEYVYYTEVSNMIWFEWVTSQRNYDWSSHEGILVELLEKNYEDKWIPKKFGIRVYGIKESEETTYLSKIDAYILGIEIVIDPGNTYLMDQWEYNTKFVKDLYPELIKNCKSIIANSESQLELDLGEKDKEAMEKRLKQVRERLDELEIGNFIY